MVQGEVSCGMNHDVIIVGGGSAGLGAARQSVAVGAKPVLVSDGPIGGDCTWTGCVPSKTLIARSRAGFTFSDAIADVHRAIDKIASHESADVLRSDCLLYTSPSPRDATLSRMPSSA